jgi:hypothetical protein
LRAYALDAQNFLNGIAEQGLAASFQIGLIDLILVLPLHRIIHPTMLLLLLLLMLNSGVVVVERQHDKILVHFHHSLI